MSLVPPLASLCIRVLAEFADQITNPQRVHSYPALVGALDLDDPAIAATVALLVHPIPPNLCGRDVPLSHPALPLLQHIPHSPDFSLVTLLSLPNCPRIRDDDVADFRSLHRLTALDLRSCSISSYALTVLARALNTSTRTGPCGLRLLTLHGCPNIDDDIHSALVKFPLLSAVDLRFTRCTPSAVDARLAPLGFRPSGNSSLFHPAPLSVALCTLEKVALTASDPISLYSCPPQSVFRVHIDELNHLPSRRKKAAIRTTSSAQDTVVFMPPLRKSASTQPRASVPASTSFPINQPTSNVSSFYENTPARNRHSGKSILPLFAQAVQSPEDGKLDPLAVARSPPPWKILDTSIPCSDSVGSSQRNQQIARWTGQALGIPLKVDRARLHKRGSDAVADMVLHFTSKRPKVESEFALAKTRANLAAKSRNPFARSAKSVFAEMSTDSSDKPQPSTHESSVAEPDMQLRTCRSLPSVRQQGTDTERTLKPLKPITTLKPPILPKELLPPPPRPPVSKPKPNLKQTRLAFAREGTDDGA